MIISVQGTLIDTDNIYSISEIWLTGGQYNDCFIFKIESFDKKELHVKSRSFEEQIMKERVETELKILRNKIIEYWNTSKQRIPMLDIEVII
jgi:hypothetical protein